MKKYFLIFLFFSLSLIARETTYAPITNIESIPEGNLTKITNINGETFEYFTIYMKPEIFKKVSTDCEVKVFKNNKNYLSLSSGGPFKCGEKTYELVNIDISHLRNPEVFSSLLDGLINEFLIPNIGKLTTLILFMFTFVAYLTTHRPNVLAIGIVLSLVIGFIIGYYNVFVKSTKFPYNSKIYIIEYYDNYEKEHNVKVFRKGIPNYRNEKKDTNL